MSDVVWEKIVEQAKVEGKLPEGIDLQQFRDQVESSLKKLSDWIVIIVDAISKILPPIIDAAMNALVKISYENQEFRFIPRPELPRAARRITDPKARRIIDRRPIFLHARSTI